MNLRATSEGNRRRDFWLFVLQRLSAMILAPLVFLHLATMVYAIQDGLTASEILSRTKGNLFWGIMYGLFIIAATIHASIGLRTIIGEMTPFRGTSRDIFTFIFASLVLALGFRAMKAVI